MKETNTRLAALDGLRGIAILSVMAFHLIIPCATGGFYGVEIFFVLSGFLITTLLLKEWQTTQTIGFLAFYVRRAFRLLPPLGLFMFTFVPFINLPDVVATLTYAVNWAIAFHWLPMREGLLNHMWSLSIEGQYYLIWPSLLYLTLKHRLPRRFVIVVLCIVVILLTLVRIAVWQDGASWYLTYYALRGDGLILGSALALAVNSDQFKEVSNRFARFATLPIMLVLLVPLATQTDDSLATNTIGFSLVAFVTAALISALLGAQGSILSRFLSSNPLVFVGQISYALYIWHVPFHILLQWLGFTRGGPLTIVVTLVLSFTFATLSYRCVERPILQWAHRFSYRSGQVNPSLVTNSLKRR